MSDLAGVTCNCPMNTGGQKMHALNCPWGTYVTAQTFAPPFRGDTPPPAPDAPPPLPDPQAVDEATLHIIEANERLRADLAAARRDRDRAEEMERYRAMELEQECRSLSAARAEADAARRERDEATAHLMDAGRSAAQHAQRADALAEALREAVEKCVSLFNGAYRVGDAENLSAVKNGRAVLARHAREGT